MKNIREFYLKISVFGGEISIYLNRRVFVMTVSQYLFYGTLGINGIMYIRQRDIRYAHVTNKIQMGLKYTQTCGVF